MRNTVEKYGRWAVVTGGSAGIGLAFANQLAAAGHNLVLVSRNQTRLDRAEQSIRAKHRVEVKTLAADLTDEGALDRLYDFTRDLDVGMAILNAGVETSGHYTKTSIEIHRGLVDLNVRVPMEMAHTFGERFVRRGRGGIVFVSSLFGYQGVPLVAGYSASKAYILSLGEALSVELKRFGVDVTVLSPGLTDTDMPAAMPINFSRLPIPNMTPEKTARAGLRALGRKISVVPGLINNIYVWENRLLPRSTPIRMFGWMVRMAFKKEQVPNFLITPAQVR